MVGWNVQVEEDGGRRRFELIPPEVAKVYSTVKNHFLSLKPCWTMLNQILKIWIINNF